MHDSLETTVTFNSSKDTKYISTPSHTRTAKAKVLAASLFCPQFQAMYIVDIIHQLRNGKS